MRKLLTIAAILALAAPVAADDEPKPKEKPEPTLKVGDKAPALSATKWLQGAEVKEFAPGKVYVVEFWATWCGPCIVMMPHMGELQREYKGRGVTFIGFTSKDPNNSLEKVQAMVAKRGPKLGYTFAYADNRDTYNAWMRAAGRNGIPCCFVVDQAGKVAYVGHPMYLDAVLPKVVAGKWTEADREALKGIEKDVSAVFKSFGDDPEGALSALADFKKKHPELAGIPYFHRARLDSLLKAKKFDEARKAAEELMAQGAKNDDPTVFLLVSAMMRSPAAKGDKELLKLSLKAAEGALKAAGEKDWSALLGVAEAHFALGDRAKAKEYGAKAAAAAESESLGVKKYVAGVRKKFEDGDIPPPREK
jgi:thiol-disulfide isomerase/thioredoxin